MSGPATATEWADKLEHIANAISHTVYDYGHKISEGYKPERQINWDDADYLRQLAKSLRGEEGQFTHELKRTTVPW